MTTPTADALIRFEGIGSGSDEIWGGIQANFLVALPGQNARETAVMLNDPGAAHLAEALGRENTPEFQALAAEIAGRLWIERLVARGQHVGGLITISRMLFQANPDYQERVLTAIKDALGAA
ncbi:MAG: hypothetical protein ACM3S1_16620 [Hyphomicrobiales bacterium]